MTCIAGQGTRGTRAQEQWAPTHQVRRLLVNSSKVYLVLWDPQEIGRKKLFLQIFVEGTILQLCNDLFGLDLGEATQSYREYKIYKDNGSQMTNLELCWVHMKKAFGQNSRSFLSLF